MPKVLHVIDSEGFYGAEAVLLDLAAELSRHGVESSILNMRCSDPFDGSLEDRSHRAGVPFHAVSLRPGLDPRGVAGILSHARAGGYDMFHSHGYKPNILLGMLPRRMGRLPIITTVHGWTNVEKHGRMVLYEWLDGLSLRFMDRVVVVNKTMTAHPRIRSLRKERVHVVTNGISKPSGMESVHDDTIMRFCNDGFTLIAIGRLSKEKGHRVLIEAFHLLVKKIQDARLIIIGEGPERQQLEALISERRLQGKVLLPGYREEAPGYFRHCKAFVLPSLTEGLPITLLEAMWAKIPIVTTGVGGIPEVINNGVHGIIVKPEDPQGLYRSIVRLHEKYDASNGMTARAYDLVREKLSSRNMALQYAQIYREVLDGSNPRY